MTTEVVPIYTTVCPVPPKHGSGGRKPRPGGYNGHDGYGVSGGGDGDVREYGHGKPRPTGELPGGAGKPRPSAGLPGAGSAASVRPKPVTAGAAGMRFGGSVAVVVGAAVAGLALLL